MSSFSANWLALREPLDHAARNNQVLTEVANHFASRKHFQICDIGCGTGSTIRAIRTILKMPINWHLVDNDAVLLGLVSKTVSDNDTVRTSNADLSLSAEILFEPPPDLITTSAFFDLVSEAWLSSLIDTASHRGTPIYAALTYDGRSECKPHHVTDKKIQSAFNRHQRTNKGFGPALGPEAALAFISLLKGADYTVSVGTSDWLAGPDHADFQRELLTGWHEAACEIEPENATEFCQWFEQRMKLIETGELNLTVGHVDVFAWKA